MKTTEEQQEHRREYQRKYQKRYRDSHRGKNKIYHKEYYKNNKPQTRQYYTEHKKEVLARYLKRAYGLTQEEYDELLKRQNGVCACCGRPNSGVTKGGRPIRMFVDHDHKTGKIRGLLCSQCNIALGMLEDSEERIRSLLDYIRTNTTCIS